MAIKSTNARQHFLQLAQVHLDGGAARVMYSAQTRQENNGAVIDLVEKIRPVAPPVACARRRRCPSAGLLPMPATNTWWPDARAAAIVLSMALISPSVTSSASLGTVWARLKVATRADSIWVPPKSALRSCTQRSAARRVGDVTDHSPRRRRARVLLRQGRGD